MRCTYVYAGLAVRSQAMTEDVAQRSRWTFYEVVNNDPTIIAIDHSNSFWLFCIPNKR